MSKDVYVVVEQRGSKVQNVGLELIGEATKLAKDLDQKVVAVLLGSGIKGEADRLIKYGADKVLVVDHPMLKEYVTEPYTKAVTKIIKECDPEIVIFGASSIGRDVAPRVAARVHTGLTADCTGLAIDLVGEAYNDADKADDSMDKSIKNLLMTRPAFGGNIMATIVCKKYRPQMATVRPGVMKKLVKDETRKGEIVDFPVDFVASDMNVEILEVVKEAKKSVDLTEAKIIVSGGRGIGGPEGFNMVGDVAAALGGEVGSSRACVDAGWIEKARQVGQTGKTVRPDLYLACGISGAIQHVAGMEHSELIISINKNDTATIFDVSDLGIVGDVKVILPKLAVAIKKFREEKALS